MRIPYSRPTPNRGAVSPQISLREGLAPLGVRMACQCQRRRLRLRLRLAQARLRLAHSH